MKEIIGPRKPRRSLRAEIALDSDMWHWTLTVVGKSLFTGNWATAVSCNEHKAEPTTSWREVCRFDDRQVHHREYERQLSGGIRHQRQITLCPQDQLIVIAETFLARRVTNWRFESRFALSPEVSLRPRDETQELGVALGDFGGAILPLALPEWKASGEMLGLTPDGQDLTARYATTGRGFFFPLCVVLWEQKEEADLEKGESASDLQRPPLTWRQLTVSECLRKVAPDEAVGFRIQVANRQWLLYRSLTRPANRAVLGHNLISESLLARFTPRGQVIPLVEVELDEESDSTNGKTDDTAAG